MTKMAAQQLGRYNINVNSICPGVTRTELGARNSITRAAERGITVAEMQARAGGEDPDPPRQYPRRYRGNGGVSCLARSAQHHRPIDQRRRRPGPELRPAPRMDRLSRRQYAADMDSGREAMPLTQDLGRFASGLTFEKLPREAVEIARTGFIDTIATMIAGAQDPAPQSGVRTGAVLRRRRAASLYFSGETAAAPEAAWINGTAGHALDYDDVGCRGHLSTVLVPAILAEAETLGAWRARDVRLLCRGIRDLGRAGAARPRPPSRQRLAPDRHLRRDRRRRGLRRAAPARRRAGDDGDRAVGVAGRRHHGQFRHDDEAVPRRPRGACRARLGAARGTGFTAAPDALEHPQGFLSAVSPEGNVDRESPPALGEEWQIVKQGLGIKKYPACYCTHRALDAMLDLLAQRPLKPAEIESITVSISKTHSLILRNHAPQTGLEAKFSMEFAMAAAIISRRASLGEYTDDFVRRPEVQELMRRVSIVTNENYDPQVSGASA